MIPVAGAVSLNLSLAFAILTLFAIGFYIRYNDFRLFLTGQRLSLASSGLSVISTIILTNELILGNFDLDYVAHYTSNETPLLYKITALWAGQSGSMLFWLAILSIYAIIVVLQNRKEHHLLMPWVIIVITIVQLFFLGMTNFVTNPFEPTNADFIVMNGNGLNPLLQNPTMAIHPPMLYLGYVGFTIPFAFAIAALIKKDASSLWIKTIRRWTLVTWLFLGIGIILGGWWAYLELGWGGYWAWDPVENASFMPWLTGTAFVHSIIIQEKKNMLKIWNMILIILTFTLCIFGTFLTRSGVMSSVHSFTASGLGPLFFGFVILILIVSYSLLYVRRKHFQTEKQLESFTSRESGFLFNNVVFVVMCFAVFWGTIFPVISEAVRGTKITVGAPFFNQINIPIGLILLFLTGVGPLLAWRNTSKESLIKNFTFPLIVAFIIVGLLLALDITGNAMMTLSLSGFVFTTIVIEFWRGIRARTRKFDESIISAFIKLIQKNRSRYGGYISHLGIVLMFVGFSGHAFDIEDEWGLQIGAKETVGNYEIELDALSEEERPNHYAYIANLNIYTSGGEFVTDLHPEKRIYFHRDPNPDKRQPHSELDIYSTIVRDIYSIFTGVDPKNQVGYFKIMINPLVQWVWIGSYFLIIGTVIAMWPVKRGKNELE
ncbi:MAG: heme lyase CcmF/NrfE family subunit [Candidatus Marinimicrobia bacterium]|jgi:cytochrome c-type biogenesis protein CcmF|nr:heme lyase CcmF/NrfE family subunit [Candidatus Neomarinimicrobiota bacterium]MBT3961879.1 heme lyase CcmF/NrfE family subunit [Candidatus Neomarinimicrobiota bacterium]MBT4382707.1 heme lyase CcmF/NrfE family subunit [Candidatus Neomarinimicrobiota bacterium]MBT4636673.1 heme lyase CcmF/NrfE family subunit [Candidatus Neomarinimicrobiota bacterium]MBT4685358.1 heme lyase CcmF/NrfE family subunit [Candidatus Neomarinimicrobiota bacterium]